jgi:hypothetical protein
VEEKRLVDVKGKGENEREVSKKEACREKRRSVARRWRVEKVG